MPSNDFNPRTEILFGRGKLNTLGDVALATGAKRVLVVSDPGILAAGHTQRGIDAIAAAGLSCQLFDGVCENPTTDHVDAGLAVAKDFQPELIVGLGGGSSMDCAKGINFLFSCGGRMQDYHGIGKATGPLLPMIAVPTTAGTGSEAQSFALISDATTQEKMACGDTRAAFRTAILDPELTLTQPPRVAALTGLDALSHAVETCVTKPRTPLSIRLSHAAWRHLAPNLLRVLNSPDDLEARSAMQLGACLSGFAIENSMLGAAHALANPLTATCGVLHGEAVSLMLPHVVRFNGREVEPLYRELLETTASMADVPQGGSEALADFLASLANQAGMAGRLKECGVQQEQLPTLAQAAAEQWTGTFNPIAMQANDFLQLYKQAF